MRRLALLLPLLPACVMHSHATEFNGVDGVRGVPVEYQTTTSYELRGLFTFSLWGNAKKADVISQFTAEAAARGATRTRIVQTSSLTWWFILPPLSFLIHPVVTTIEGDVETQALP
jgi:hypothetical protein